LSIRCASTIMIAKITIRTGTLSESFGATPAAKSGRPVTDNM